MRNTSLTRKLSLSLAGISVALMSFAYSAGVANATTTTTEISIPVSTIVRHIGVGESKVLTTKDIDQNYRGMVCSVKADAVNQGSVHPGNNLVIKSGNDAVTLEDVERAANVVTHSNGELTLADKVTVSLVMGQDNVFSAGMDVVLTCEPEIEVCRDGQIITIKESARLESDTDTCPADIQVCRDGEIITITEDQRLATDTDVCPAQIQVCRDGQIITITEDQKLATDTDVCPADIQVCRDGEIITITEDQRLATDTDVCPTPKQVEVCRDGKVITVNEDEVLTSDIEGSCPQTLGTQTLPNTGAGSIATSMLSLSTVMAGAYGFVKNRR